MKQVNVKLLLYYTIIVCLMSLAAVTKVSVDKTVELYQKELAADLKHNVCVYNLGLDTTPPPSCGRLYLYELNEILPGIPDDQLVLVELNEILPGIPDDQLVLVEVNEPDDVIRIVSAPLLAKEAERDVLARMLDNNL